MSAEDELKPLREMLEAMDKCKIHALGMSNSDICAVLRTLLTAIIFLMSRELKRCGRYSTVEEQDRNT